MDIEKGLLGGCLIAASMVESEEEKMGVIESLVVPGEPPQGPLCPEFVPYLLLPGSLVKRSLSVSFPPPPLLLSHPPSPRKL